jgi:hypothetical protein
MTTRKSLSMQEASQGLASIMLGLSGHSGIRYTIKAMIRSRVHMEFDRHSCTAQSIRIGQIFFQEEIETADRNIGWRQPDTSAARAAAA